MSNITPQKSTLNQFAWKNLEGMEQQLLRSVEEVLVATGPLYEKKMKPLPKADEPHTVPSGYWKVVMVPTGDPSAPVKAAAFIFDQGTSKKSKVLKHLTTIDEVERRSGFDILWDLPNEMEDRMEADKNETWAGENFK